MPHRHSEPMMTDDKGHWITETTTVDREEDVPGPPPKLPGKWEYQIHVKKAGKVEVIWKQFVAPRRPAKSPS